MGNVNCCHQNNNKNEENNKLYQINRNKYHGNKNNNKYQILSYDIEENILYKNYVKIPILASLEGISELNLNSNINISNFPIIIIKFKLKIVFVRLFFYK